MEIPEDKQDVVIVGCFDQSKHEFKKERENTIQAKTAWKTKARTNSNLNRNSLVSKINLITVTKRSNSSNLSPTN